MDYKNVKGTHDVILNEADAYSFIEAILRNVAERFNFKEFRIPVLESTSLFNRSVGESSDIVRKEMYTFLDKGDREITLRPEFTAGIIRSFVNAKLYANASLPVKAHYVGPVFRYERPQLGRYRQFNQFGVELIGATSLYHDLEVILMGYEALRALHLDNVKILINTLGDQNSRDAYRNALKEHFIPVIDNMCPDCKNRLELNPLRILDCKVKEDKQYIQSAPKIKDFLSDESKERFEIIKDVLKALEIPYEIDDTLVRGLDYYSEVVFEYHYTTQTGINYGAIGAGGHYSSLVKEIGGPSLDGVGLSFGVERLYSVLRDDNLLPDFNELRPLHAIFLPLSEKTSDAAFALATLARRNGFISDIDYSYSKVGTLLKKASKANADFAIILGEEEMEQSNVNIKNLHLNSQETISLNEVCDYLKESYEKMIRQQEEEIEMNLDEAKEYES